MRLNSNLNVGHITKMNLLSERVDNLEKLIEKLLREKEYSKPSFLDFKFIEQDKMSCDNSSMFDQVEFYTKWTK